MVIAAHSSRTEATKQRSQESNSQIAGIESQEPLFQCDCPSTPSLCPGAALLKLSEGKTALLTDKLSEGMTDLLTEKLSEGRTDLLTEKLSEGRTALLTEKLSEGKTAVLTKK